MLQFNSETKKSLIDLFNSRNIALEGNILRVIDITNDEEFSAYIQQCLARDKQVRKKRLEITRRIQSQNNELSKLNTINQSMMVELQETLKNIEESKKHIEIQNRELVLWKEDNQRISQELLEEMKKADLARLDAENAKKIVENDLDVLQKRTQFGLINTIVRIALYVIIGVGVTTTLLYLIAILTNKETQVVGSTWSNILGILLTNAFSIVGTIMGVKYASDKK